MNELFEWIGKVVLSVGGAGVIIISISTFLAKFWTDYYMKKVTARYDKEMEEYKAQLTAELNKIKVMNDLSYEKKRLAFEMKLPIFKEIVPLAVKVIEGSLGIGICLEVKNKDSDYSIPDDVCDRVERDWNEYRNLYITYAGFIPAEIYECFSKIGNDYVVFSVEVMKNRDKHTYYTDELNPKLKNLKLDKEMLLKLVRDYLE
ncbi:hypothetical protein [Lacrimispora sp.]|uniref:hypothetical protein n=1 Tax=Lacrimispora sp. TaxID=2719234 RepID=UPI0032E3A24A